MSNRSRNRARLFRGYIPQARSLLGVHDHATTTPFSANSLQPVLVSKADCRSNVRPYPEATAEITGEEIFGQICQELPAPLAHLRAYLVGNARGGLQRPGSSPGETSQLSALDKSKATTGPCL